MALGSVRREANLFGRRLGRDVPAAVPCPLAPIGIRWPGLATVLVSVFAFAIRYSVVESSLSLVAAACQTLWRQRRAPGALRLLRSRREAVTSVSVSQHAKALRAEDRTVVFGLEGNFGHLAALGAGGRMHLARGAAAEAGERPVVDVSFAQRASTGLAGAAAGVAARRLVEEATVGVKCLFAGAEGKAGTTISAGQDSIDVWHIGTPVSWQGLVESRGA